MQGSRRAYLRGTAAIALGVGVAGCSSGDEGDGDGESSGSSGGSGASGSSPANETNESKSDDAVTEGETASSETVGKDPAATDLTGTVSDKSAKDLAFVEQNHYSMNGVQGVTGRVKNTGDAPYGEVTIHVTVDPGDAGPYTETLDADEPLEPGETRRFKFGFGDDVPDEVEGYTIWATGQTA